MKFAWKFLTSPAPTSTIRRSKRMAFSWDGLEERKVLSHGGGLHHVTEAVQIAPASISATPASSTLTTAKQTLQTEIQTILGASGTTVAELSALHTSFQTLETDGLKPTSQAALKSFENSLVTSFASGTTLTGNATLLAQFEALYTATPTTQQTTDLTTAYNALAAAVTSSGVTSADITAINTDFSAVLTAASSTSTATFPYFSLVLGEVHEPVGFGGHGGISLGQGSGSSSNSTLATAEQTLKTEVGTILAASGTTVAELTAIHTSFQTLQTDGLKPSSGSALTSFENSLVTSFASGTTLTGNATLLAQFEALYTATPTTQQTTDLTTAYNALAAAVTSSGVTSADITAINTDFSAVLTAASSTSTATFPYFTLITGGFGGFGGGFGGFGGLAGFGTQSMGGRC